VTAQQRQQLSLDSCSSSAAPQQCSTLPARTALQPLQPCSHAALQIMQTGPLQIMQTGTLQPCRSCSYADTTAMQEIAAV